MMILVFLLLLSVCAACHTCEDPAFERITSTTIIEKKEVGFSGLLVILENSVRNLAEKQANMTSGMNHSYFNLADSAVGNDAYNHDEEIFLADSRNESNLSNCSLSLQSTPPDTKNYHLYLNTLTPVSPTGGGGPVRVRAAAEFKYKRAAIIEAPEGPVTPHFGVGGGP